MQIMLYKGFTILTNTKHDLAAPETAPDMLLAILAQNIRVIVSAFILGTLMHYLVKKDPEIKAMKELMADLDQYCAQRHLPHDLATKMKEHINYQQRHSSAVSSRVQQVRYSCFTPCIMPALQDIVAALGGLFLLSEPSFIAMPLTNQTRQMMMTMLRPLDCVGIGESTAFI
jgi:hypothetical protein